MGVLHCLTCIRVKYHIRNFVWGVATLDVWSSSTRTFQPKKRIPRNDQFLFILCLKKWVFQAHRRVPTPHDWCRRTMKKELFCKENQWNRVVILKKIKFYPKYFYPKTQKMSNLLGFAHVFDIGISLFLWYLLWHCLCTPKFYPKFKYVYLKYSKFFFSVHTRRVEIGHILSTPSTYIYIYIHKATKYSKYPVSSSILGMPREAKVPIPHSMWVEDLIYIYVHTLFLHAVVHVDQ